MEKAGWNPVAHKICSHETEQKKEIFWYMTQSLGIYSLMVGIYQIGMASRTSQNNVISWRSNMKHLIF